MATPGEKSVTPDRPRRQAWRPLVRSLHRDLGYLLVGLTVIYAVSGLAVNHVADWDPSFTNYTRAHALPMPLPLEDEAILALLRQKLDLPPGATIVFSAPTRIDVQSGARIFHIDPSTGRVVEEGRRPRAFLRAANWLHLNRGKKAWTVVADAYAVGLLLLAFSGLFMLPGRKGVLGRGGFFVLLGAAVPILYVLLSGGP